MRTLYRGGMIYSTSEPFATALLVDGGTVAWLGSDQAATARATDADEVVELDDALVTPAFVDAHVHVTETGLALDGLDLRAARSVREILAAVEAAARRGRGRPVLGHGWDERHLAEGRPPTRTELDRACAGGVVQLNRVDGHSSVVSTALAEAADARGRDGWSDDGRVERDAHHAVRAATRAGLTPAARAHAQRAALRAAAVAGIGCVHEMSAPHIAPEADLAALVALAGPDGDEPFPDVVAYRGQLVADEADAKGLVARLQEVGVELAGLAGDLNADGAVGSRTAAFREPYADAPGSSGHVYLSLDEVRDHVVACTAAGLQAGFHVIGDAGLDVVLEGFRRAAERTGIAAVRSAAHRLEHVETPDADAVARLADLGVTASVQPAFDAAWGGPDGMYAARLGAGRAVRMNPFAALAVTGVPLAFGSDSPVTPFAPWEGVRAAAFHTDPQQRISAKAAFAAHTRGGWRAARRPGQGVLALGAPATLAVWAAGDLVVQAPDERIQAWSTDPRSGTPGLPDLRPGTAAPRCLRTVVRGRTLHDALGEARP
jgi:predicted amidohydrolase YtcJ